MARPSSLFTGSCFIFASSLTVATSERRSFLLATRTMGTLGQKCFTSGCHFSRMFSRESGESMLKHIRITSVSGYDSGRSRS
uniref:Putative secreted protein n=1 Tax=Ixodes ricinus TaxID=34613 RepID=A0A6B0TWK0_IXORI